MMQLDYIIYAVYSDGETCAVDDASGNKLKATYTNLTEAIDNAEKIWGDLILKSYLKYGEEWPKQLHIIGYYSDDNYRHSEILWETK